MKKKTFELKNSTNIIIPIMSGVIISLIISVLLMIAGSIMMNNEVVGETSLPWIVMIIWPISVCVGTIIPTFACKINKIVIPSVTALLYLVVLISIKMLFIDSDFTGIGQGIAAIVVGVLPSLFIITQNKPGKSKKYKYRQ